MDDTGQPLPGVTITISSGTKNFGTTTDTNGKFSIKADRGQVLKFSYIGL
jgi:uncharacterized GH25 family protein